jgi:hypothetical protein
MMNAMIPMEPPVLYGAGARLNGTTVPSENRLTLLTRGPLSAGTSAPARHVLSDRPKSGGCRHNVVGS